MKKTLSLLLALVLSLSVCLSLTTVAFAATDTTGWKSDATTMTDLTKTYTGGAPNEKLTFTVTPGSSNPDGTTLTIPDLQVSGESNTITVNIPEYTQVGTYTYTIKENSGTTMGVAYDSKPIALTVFVTYDYDNEKLNAQVSVAPSADAQDGSKKTTFTNEYSTGSLAVTKEVTGNMGNRSDEFHATVKFSSTGPVRGAITYTDDGNDYTIPGGWIDDKEVEITLKHGETVTFTNIPAGVTYTVVETEENQNDYATTYSGASGTIGSDPSSCTITNNKDVPPPQTGLFLDNLPYIVILAVVAAGAVVLFLRKRRVTD